MKRLILAAMLLSTPALADQNCAPREKFLQFLGQGYGEQVLLRGIAGTTLLAEFWINPKTGTWTMTTTAGNGLMCQLASGTDFEIVKQGEPA